MTRDYKHARGRRGSLEFSGVTGLVVGLAIGLAAAAAIYVHDRRPGTLPAATVAPMTADETPPIEKPAPASQSAEPETQLDFYEMLPKFEVVIPEREKDVRPNGPALPVDRPGAYILQAGSFRNPADAERMRAVLALQGIESKVQKVAVDSDTWHRVRIGPVTDLKALDETRRKLREAQIDALVIRVGE
jgi:cell division protein FtsN